MDSPLLSDLRLTCNTELEGVHRDQAWWRLEASRCGADWPGIIASHAKAVAIWRSRHDPDYERAVP